MHETRRAVPPANHDHPVIRLSDDTPNDPFPLGGWMVGWFRPHESSVVMSTLNAWQHGKPKASNSPSSKIVELVSSLFKS